MLIINSSPCSREKQGRCIWILSCFIYLSNKAAFTVSPMILFLRAGELNPQRHPSWWRRRVQIFGNQEPAEVLKQCSRQK